MQRTFSKFLLIFFILLALTFSTPRFHLARAVGSWMSVGATGFSAGEAWSTSLAFDNTGVPYIAYQDVANSSKATVMKFNGTSWETVGTAGFSSGEPLYISLYLDGGTPYLAYQDYNNNYKATVMKFDGTSWMPVGTTGFSTGAAWYTSLAVDAGIPYVAYGDIDNGGDATVKKFNGTSWESVGNPGFSAGEAIYTSLALNGGIPYVAYRDVANSNKATVMKFNGTSWEPVGNPGFSIGAVASTSIVFDNAETPYVAYRDVDNGSKATVMKFNGVTWETVGIAGFSTGEAWDPSLSLDGETPYVAYRDMANSNKATVMKFNGTSWEPVGTPGFSTGVASYTSLVVDRGTPYVAYRDMGNGGKATVMKFDIIAPTVSTITRVSTSPSSATSVDFTVTFSEPVTGVSTSAPFNDFQLFTTGVSGASITSVTSVSASVYTVSVNTGSGNGTIRLDVPNTDTIKDQAGNPLGELPYQSGDVYTITKSYTVTSLVNSVLPTSRTTAIGNTTTIFNTVVNAGSNTAYGVTLSMSPAPAGTFIYTQTNCNTNAVIGTPNSAVDIPPGGVACYVLSFTPSAAFSATRVHIQAQASNASATALLPGINTWLLRSTASAGPDIIALTTTTDFHQVTCSGTNAFAVAMSNVGAAASGDITVTANTGSASLPISVSIQETNPGTGAIIGDHILNNLGAGENRTVAVFVTFHGCVSFDPAVNRIFIEFRDASNNVVGSTSTAVSTNR